MNDPTPRPAPDTDREDESGGIDLRTFLRVVNKYRWVIAATVAVVVTGAALYTLRLPKIYTARATVVMDPRPPDLLGSEVQEVVQMGAGSYWLSQEYYNTQIGVLTSRELARLTVKRGGFHRDPRVVGPIEGDGRTDPQRIEVAAARLIARLTITPPRNSRIMTVAVDHEHAEVAAAMVNTHVATYIQYSLDLRIEGSDVAAKWLSTELDTSEKALRESEVKLYEFMRENDILSVSLEDRRNLVATNITRFTDALNDARTTRIEIETLRERLREASKVETLESPLFALADSSRGEGLKNAYHTARRELMDLQADFDSRHPAVQTQKGKVDDLHKELEREATLILATVEERYRAARATEAAFEREVERYKQEAFELGPKAVEYNRLARQEQSRAEQYRIMLNRLRDADLTGRLNTVNVRSLDEARLPTSPSYPSVSRNVGAAGALSLLLGIGLAFLIHLLDRTVKTGEDAEQTVGAPVLGIIPIVALQNGKAKDQREKDLHVFNDPGSRAAECCRSIRTNLLFMGADREFKTLVVSSASPREGKSTTVYYLGTTMAQSGQRTLLIDSDMRRPRLHQSVGVSRAQGLSNLILGDATVDDVVKTTDIPNLYVLPCGPTPPNPAELLMTDRFAEVLRELSGRFDRILLDSPPVLAVTDAAVLARQVDGVVLVLKAGVTTREAGSRAARALHDVKARIAGVVLNELDLEDRSYGYYYRYYAYGYGAKESSSRAEPAASA